MATLVPENLACIKSCNDLNNFELSQENSVLLMSLLDDTQGLDDDNDRDNERLTSVIKSLESEIDQRMMDSHDLFQENQRGFAKSEYCESCDQSEMDNTYSTDDHEVDGHVSEYCYGVCLEENNYNSSLWEEQYPQY